MFCSQCGAEIPESAKFCPSCGATAGGAAAQQPQYPQQQPPPQAQASYARPAPPANVSPSSRLVAILLCFFVGGLGVHRFYVGKIGTGILWLLTGALLGIGWLVDLIMIAAGTFKDKQGRVVYDWQA